MFTEKIDVFYEIWKPSKLRVIPSMIPSIRNVIFYHLFEMQHHRDLGAEHNPHPGIWAKRGIDVEARHALTAPYQSTKLETSLATIFQKYFPRHVLQNLSNLFQIDITDFIEINVQYFRKPKNCLLSVSSRMWGRTMSRDRWSVSPRIPRFLLQVHFRLV